MKLVLFIIVIIVGKGVAQLGPANTQNQCGQVQICAPLPNLYGQEALAQGFKGQKGDPGSPGLMGIPVVCPSVTFTFPRHFQTEDYVWYRGYVPGLKSATTCFWTETSNIPSGAEFTTIASYAMSSTYGNDQLIYYKSDTSMNFEVQTTRKIAALRIPHLRLRHVCTWFNSSRMGVYMNGRQLHAQTNTGGSFAGGGSLILGQEQDSINAGGLQSRQSFSGSISNFMIWPRVLTHDEINDIFHNCSCPTDHAVAMTMDRVELHGDAGYEIPDVCPVSS